MSEAVTAWPTSNHVDPTTCKVRCWDLTTGKYVSKYAIDVHEGLRVGSIARFDPEDNKSSKAAIDDAEALITEIKTAKKARLEEIITSESLQVTIEDGDKLSDIRNKVLKALG